MAGNHYQCELWSCHHEDSYEGIKWWATEREYSTAKYSTPDLQRLWEVQNDYHDYQTIEQLALRNKKLQRESVFPTTRIYIYSNGYKC